MARSPFDSLVRDGVLSAQALAEATRQASAQRLSVGWVLVREKNVPLETVGKALSTHYRVPFVAWKDDLQPLREDVDRVGESICLDQHIAPIARENGRVVVLMADPNNLPLKDQLTGLFPAGILPRVALQEHIHRVFTGEEPRPAAPPSASVPMPLEAEPETMEAPAAESDGLVRLINAVLIRLLNDRGEELRIDPRQTPAAAWRVGGRWNEIEVPEHFLQPLVRRLKVMANLDLGNRAKAQRGFFTLALAGSKPRFDVAIEPLGGGDEAARVSPAVAP